MQHNLAAWSTGCCKPGQACLLSTGLTNLAGLTLVGRMPSEVSSGREQRKTSCRTTALPPAAAQLPERTAASMSTNSLSACRRGSGLRVQDALALCKPCSRAKLSLQVHLS